MLYETCSDLTVDVYSTCGVENSKRFVQNGEKHDTIELNRFRRNGVQTSQVKARKKATNHGGRHYSIRVDKDAS